MLGPKKLRHSSWQLVPRDGEDNHVHLVVRYPPRCPPTVNWSAVVGTLRSCSASAYLIVLVPSSGVVILVLSGPAVSSFVLLVGLRTTIKVKASCSLFLRLPYFKLPLSVKLWERTQRTLN